MVWTQEQLGRSPEQDLRIACTPSFSDDARLAAWQRYEVKRYYEGICGSKVGLDLNDMEPQIAAEVARLRSLAGGSTPWLEPGKRGVFDPAPATSPLRDEGEAPHISVPRLGGPGVLQVEKYLHEEPSCDHQDPPQTYPGSSGKPPPLL